MTAFRIGLVAMFGVLLIYTGLVIKTHGLGLFPVFFGDIARMGWPGQFNLDFLGFLVLSALWVAWRQGFTLAGLGLAVIAFFGGIGFLAPYLFILSLKTNGDMTAILLGVNRSQTGG